VSSLPKLKQRPRPTGGLPERRQAQKREVPQHLSLDDSASTLTRAHAALLKEQMRLALGGKLVSSAVPSATPSPGGTRSLSSIFPASPPVLVSPG